MTAAEGNETPTPDRERLLADFRKLAELPCKTGKQRHPTKEAARAQAMSLRANRGPDRTTAYRCTLCGSWHVGRR